MTDPSNPNARRGVAKTVVESAITGPASDPWGQPSQPTQASPAQQSPWGGQPAQPAPTGNNGVWGDPTSQPSGSPSQPGSAWGGQQGQPAGNAWGGQQGQPAGNAWGGQQGQQQFGGGGGGGGNQWSPGAGGAQPVQSKGGKGCLIAVVGLIAAFTGCIGLGVWASGRNGDAEINDVAIVESYMAEAYVHVTYTFLEEPVDGDLRDVELRIKADAIDDELSFDWTYLANNDQDPTTTPDADPPLNVPIEIWVPLEAALSDNVYVTEGDEPDLVVRLFWDGSRQSRESVSIGVLYGGAGGPAPQVPIPPPAGGGLGVQTPAGGGYGTPAQQNFGIPAGGKP